MTDIVAQEVTPGTLEAWERHNSLNTCQNGAVMNPSTFMERVNANGVVA